MQHTQHPNGIIGTAGVTIAVKSLAMAKPQFDVVFGAGTRSGHGLRYALGAQWVDVIESDVARGEGVSSVTLLKPGAGTPKPLQTGLALFVSGA